MLLETKLGLFNGLSKLLLVLLGALLIPPVVQRVAVLHTDEHLQDRKAALLRLLGPGGQGLPLLRQAARADAAAAAAPADLLRQEYLTLSPLPDSTRVLTRERIVEEPRRVGLATEDFRILRYEGSLAGPGGNFRLEIGSSLATIELLTTTLRRLALWVLVAGALATVFADAAFARYLLAPLRELMRRKLRGIRQPGEFSFERLPTNTTDFRQLDDALSALMRQLQASFEKEREFMSNVSHELLTPASILQSRFENMLQDPTLPEQHAAQIVESQRTLYRLRNTVRTLLLIANIENEQYLREDSVSLCATARDVAEELDDRRQQRDIHLALDLAPDYVVRQANATLLHTLLRNLLANAFKYSYAGSHVRVLGRPRPGGGYALRVEDDGPGIAAEHHALLFDRFRRFTGGGAQAPEGYGLGLPIAQTIAEFHHAGLRVESEVGKGTAFVLEFGPTS